MHQQETLTEQVSDLLDLLVPGDGHRLFTLGEWHHSPDLASEIIEWLASTLYGEEESRPRQSKVLSDEGSMVWSAPSICWTTTGGWRSTTSDFTIRRPVSTNTGSGAQARSRQRQ